MLTFMVTRLAGRALVLLTVVAFVSCYVSALHTIPFSHGPVCTTLPPVSAQTRQAGVPLLSPPLLLAPAARPPSRRPRLLVRPPRHPACPLRPCPLRASLPRSAAYRRRWRRPTRWPPRAPSAPRPPRRQRSPPWPPHSARRGGWCPWRPPPAPPCGRLHRRRRAWRRRCRGPSRRRRGARPPSRQLRPGGPLPRIWAARLVNWAASCRRPRRQAQKRGRRLPRRPRRQPVTAGTLRHRQRRLQKSSGHRLRLGSHHHHLGRWPRLRHQLAASAAQKALVNADAKQGSLGY